MNYLTAEIRMKAVNASERHMLHSLIVCLLGRIVKGAALQERDSRVVDKSSPHLVDVY